MSFKFSPQIVTNGLVFALDAANYNSYPENGTTWYDISGNSNNGTFSGDPTFTTDNGGAIVFDGTGDRIDVGNPTILQLDAFTISVWFYFEAFGGLVSKRDGFPNNMAYSLFIFQTTNLPTLDIGTTRVTANTALTTNNWYNLTATYDNTTANIYLNSSLDKTQAATNSMVDGGNLFIAQLGGNTTYTFTGRIPIVNIYNRALPSEEVVQNYNAHKSRFNLQ